MFVWRKEEEASVLVIDIGSSSLKILDIDKSRGEPVIKKFYIKEFPPEIQEKIFPDNDFLATSLKEALTNTGIETKSVIFVLPDYFTDLIVLTMPKQTKEELKTSLRWELNDRITFPIDEAVFDYVIIREFEEAGVPKMSLLIAVIRRDKINEYVRLLTGLGLEPISFSIGFPSFRHVVKRSGLVNEDEDIAILDLGANASRFGIFKGDSLMLFRKIDSGSREITLALMNEATDFYKAEDIKRQAGVLALDTGQEEVEISLMETAQRNFGLARVILEGLVSKTGENIIFYKESLKGSRIKKLFIFGGGAGLKGLKTFLSSILDVSVFSPDPFIDAVVEAGNMEGNSVILARAWGAFLEGVKGINLLPDEIKFRRKIEEMHLLIKVGTCAAVTLLVLICGWTAIKGMAITKRISAKNYEYSQLGPNLEKINNLNADRLQLQKKMDMCVELLNKEPFWEDILKEIGRLIPDNIVLSSIKVRKPGLKAEEGAMDVTGKSEEGITLILEGTVYPGELSLERSLTGFLTVLSESDFFYETRLNISKEAKANDKAVLNFIIQSFVHPPQVKDEG